MKKGPIIYFILLIASLICISFFGGSASYAFFYSIIILFMMSFLYTLAVLICFKIYQKIETRTVVVDEETGYYFVLQNMYPFAFSGIKIEMYSGFFEIKDDIKSEPYTLMPGEKISFNTKITCKYRGEYPVGVKSVVVSDFMKLFSYRFKLHGSLNAIVEPKVVKLGGLLSISSNIVTDLESQNNGTEIIDASVRNYEKGDSIKKIHWKATAKTGELKVRNMFDEKKRGILIFFDGKRYSKDMNAYLPYENKVLEVVLALGSYFVQEGIEVDITYPADNGVKQMNIVNQGMFEQFYSQMCSYAFSEKRDSKTDMELYIEKCIRLIPKLAFFVVEDVSSNLIEKTERLIKEGIHCVIYVVGKTDNEPYKEFYSENRQIITVGIDMDVERVL